jgi:uncharacterized membrane protein
MKKNINTKDITAIAIVAVLYVVLSVALPAVSYGPIQFRVSELLNFIIIPKRKYALGVILGVFLANFFSPFALDIFFGTLHTSISFLVSILLFNVVKQKKWQYGVVIVVFSCFIGIIAYELALLDNDFTVFWQLYGTLFLSELIVLSLGAPIMYTVEQQLQRTRFFS